MDVLESKAFVRVSQHTTPMKTNTLGDAPIWIKRPIMLNCVEFPSSSRPFIYRNLEDKKDKWLTLLIDRGMMEVMEFSADALLGAARQESKYGTLRESNTVRKAVPLHVVRRNNATRRAMSTAVAM